MAKKTAGSDWRGVRRRLADGKLTKKDMGVLDQLVVSAIELQKAIDGSAETVGKRRVIAKLPFGVDIVK